MSTTGYEYQGDELALFQHATNWKGYFKQQIAPYFTGDVLEVGAGLGGTTAHLLDGRQRLRSAVLSCWQRIQISEVT